MVGMMKGKIVMKRMISLISLVMVFLLLGCANTEDWNQEFFLAHPSIDFIESINNGEYVGKLITNNNLFNQYVIIDEYTTIPARPLSQNRGYILLWIDIVTSSIEIELINYNGNLRIIITQTSSFTSNFRMLLLIPVAVRRVNNQGIYNILISDGSNLRVDANELLEHSSVSDIRVRPKGY